MSEWFRELDESLWLEGDDSGERSALFIKQVLRLRRGSRLLDAPSGAGRIAVHLARAGCLVTCVDLNATFIERARRCFAAEGLDGQFVVADLRQLDFRQQFDGICNWDLSFGYFSDEENADVLRRFAQALKANGRVLIDQLNRDLLLDRPDRTVRFETGTRHDHWNAATQRMDSVWTIKREGGEATFHSSIRLYTPAEFRELFDLAGLKWEAAYGKGHGSRASRRLIAVGQKL